MTAQPIAIYRDGSLWLMDACAYEPADRAKVALMAQLQASLNCEEARERAKACQTALAQYEQAQRESAQ